jgi:micrococcal nuclease
MIGLVAKVGVGLLATAGAVSGVVVATNPSQSPPEQAVVVHHVDGDTFDVEVNGAPERIRLINIDTPETRDPEEPVQCLGPEAPAFLANLVPLGSPVRLEFDRERRDPYGRTVAAVFTADGKMINAEVARAGLARVVTYGNKDRFRPPIEQASEEAAANGRGLHSTDVPCTLPAQAKTVNDAVYQAPVTANQPTAASSQDLYAAADRTGLARQGAVAFLITLDRVKDDMTWTALTVAEQTRILDQARTARDTTGREEDGLRSAAVAARGREDEAARIAAQAEADRVAKQQEAARIAAQAESDRVAKQQEAARLAAQAEADRVARKQAADRAAAEQRAAAAARRQAAASAPIVEAEPAPSPSVKRHTGNTGHPCLPGERDGDNDGYCGEGR